MWKSVCCEVQGSGHKAAGLPCQDKTCKMVRNGVYVIALADGAGSARLSHYGAERVVRDASEYLAEHFQECFDCDDGRKVKKALLGTLLQGLEEEAQRHKCDIRDLASTLLLAAVNETSFILAHIGDGVIGFLDGGRLKVASTPDNGEYCNVTTFVTSAEALSSMRLFKGELKDKDAFVLMSDGTEQSLYHKSSKTLASVIVRLMHRTTLIDGKTMWFKLEEALESVVSKRTQDDCSLAILARPSTSLPPLDMLDCRERQKLYGMAESGRRMLKRTERYDAILAIVKEPCSLEQIARGIHLKPKYARKHVDKLVSQGLIVKRASLYQRC